MTFTVFRRHNRDICESTNRYEPRCGCPLHVQFVWKGAPGVFEGKKLAYQNKWSLETRSWSEAQTRVNDLEKRLKDFVEGKRSTQRRRPSQQPCKSGTNFVTRTGWGIPRRSRWAANSWNGARRKTFSS